MTKAKCPGGEIGRHKGLKIPRTLRPCRFDSGPGYQQSNELQASSLQISSGRKYGASDRQKNHFRLVLQKPNLTLSLSYSVTSKLYFFAGACIIRTDNRQEDPSLAIRRCRVLFLAPEPLNQVITLIIIKWIFFGVTPGLRCKNNRHNKTCHLNRLSSYLLLSLATQKC